MRSFLIIIIIGLSLLGPGCASLMQRHRDKVWIEITSDPPSFVTIDTLFAGPTPVIASVERDKTHMIEFRVNGYETRTVALTKHVAPGWLLLDIIFGLIPMALDSKTGAWYNLDETKIHVGLRRDDISPSGMVTHGQADQVR